MVTRQKKKEKAIEYMTMLDIYDEYVFGFREYDTVCLFEKFSGYWAYLDPELIKKIREVEKRYNCLVYAVTHEYTEVGELYDFLVVTDDEEEWDKLLEKNIIDYSSFVSTFSALVYIWNADYQSWSGLGLIGIQSFDGGIMRYA